MPKRSEKIKNYIGLLVCLGFLAMGIYFIVIGVRDIAWAMASDDWPSVEGVITHSEAVESHSDDRISFSAVIEYEYVRRDTIFTGDRRKFGAIFAKDEAEAEAIVAEYPLDSSVTVYHHPSDPSISVLEPGMHLTTPWEPIFGCFATLISGILIYAVITHMRNERQAENDPRRRRKRYR